MFTALAVYALLRTELYLHIFPDLGEPAMPLKDSYYHFGVLSLYRGTFFLLVSAGYWFASHALNLERQQRRQEQQLLTAQNSLMEADLAFLKSQINPHFLFNSLNFLYAQVYPHSAAAAKATLLLSDTMRYALQESRGGKVMLEHEVQHLRNYIALHQLRFNNQLQVRFEIAGNVHFLMILPLVLITFVENCFKHGELTDAAHPVLIRLAVEHGQLRFQTHNRKRLGPKEISTSIGLANTERRLALVYPARYRVSVADERDSYTATLLIDL
ncbi:sensor histidine kinase [uncultured Hymenobacter sp.]|uniref:sensor histidine kinase n=1 Tax=uncultured Hymenobacter sp. TaxID=170016 RepID=UPI0035CB1CA0